MNSLTLPSNSTSADWLVYLAILIAAGVGITCFIIWFFIFRKTGKKRRKRRYRHLRQINPTLAETGGLPPPRKPDEPPRGI